ncbi:uncharacterized protein LOC135503621 isoform X2 [Lineus longissimus]|uniref:uncharacterized protein LOC135503621 isoform X2 n=1 Tax=Lineus longissimus TaxID=88925 RepID=UPI00315D16E0
MEIDEITVIILKAKDLHPKKKGRGKYSVIFGIGGNKYRTDVIRDSENCPMWNQESIIVVQKATNPLKIVVTDHEDVLGQIVVPLQCLQTKKTRPEEAPLRAHKKCSHPQGELTFQAWISKFHTRDAKDVGDDDVSLIAAPGGGFTQESTSQSMGSLPRRNSHNPLAKLKDKFTHKDKDSSESGGKLGAKGKRGSLSVLNLSFGRRSSKSKAKDDESSGRMVRANSTFAFGTGTKFSLSSSSKAHSCMDLNQPVGVPKIADVTPNEVMVDGGVKITISGEFLGNGREDVIGLFLASLNCLDTLEYESPKRIHCWTKTWKPCSGPVVVVTQSGGRGVSNHASTQFAFLSSQDIECDSINGEMFERNNNLNLSLSSEETGYVSDGSKKDHKEMSKEEKRLSLLSVPGQENPHPKPEKKHKRTESLQNILQALAPTKDKSSSLTKADMITELQKIKMENLKLTADNQGLKTRNQNLLIQNKELQDQNDNLKVYIDKLLTRVIDKCPDVLKN